MNRWCAPFLIGLFVALPARALAGPASPVWTVRGPECAELPFDRAELERLLELELADLAPDRSPSMPAFGGRVELELADCPSESHEVRVTIVALDGEHERVRLATAVRLHDVPEASRPRTLALAVAEWARLAHEGIDEASDEPDVSRVAVPSKAVSTPEHAPPRGPDLPPERSWRAPDLPPRAPDPPLSFGVFGVGSAFARELPPFFGGGVEVSRRFARRVAGRAAFSFERSEGPVALGRVAVDAWSAALGVDLLILDAPRWAMGPVVRGHLLVAGARSARGVVEDPATEMALATTLRTSLDADLASLVALRLAVEGGFFPRTATFTGGGAPIVGFSGAVGRLEIGVVVDWP